MKFGAMAVSGVVGLVVLKLLAALFMPMLMTAFAVMAMLVKWGLIIAVGYFVWSFFKGRKCEPEVA